MRNKRLFGILSISVFLGGVFTSGCEDKPPQPVPENLPEGKPEKLDVVPPLKPVAGKIEGFFEVTNRGTARYTIPIKTPPGRLGIEPRLSLEYNSSTRRGIAGLGWTIKGLSEIRRVGSEYAKDGALVPVRFNSDDNFELDGNRLVEVKGLAPDREYRTEAETYSRVVAYGDPITCFKVWAKDGKILTYGSKSVSGTSSIVWGMDGEVRRWLLKSVEDRYGNSMAIRYYNRQNTQGVLHHQENVETVEYYPLEISYTYMNNTGGTAQRTVHFSYIVDHRGATAGFHAGARVERGLLLSQIKSHVLGEEGWQNTYFLSYEESPVSGRARLNKIIETDGKGNYLHPTELVYSDGEVGWKASQRTEIPYPMERDKHSFPLDVNGDGYDDIMSQGYPGDYSRFRLAINNGGATDPPYSFPQPIDLNIDAHILGALDYNRDGLMDIAYFEKSSHAYAPTIKIRQSEGDDFGPEIDTNISTNIGAEHLLAEDNTPESTKLKYIHLVDLNGDRARDLLICRMGYDGHPHWYYHLHNGAGFDVATRLDLTDELESRDAFEHKLLILDYNGDGAMDVLLGHRYGGANFSAFFVTTRDFVFDTNLPVFPFRLLQLDDENIFEMTEDDVPPEETKWHELPVYRVLDHNGDGLQDIMLLANEEDTWHRSRLWINTGRGFEQKDFVVFADLFPPEHGKHRRGVKVIDWDGDGRHDLLAPMSIQPGLSIAGRIVPVGDEKHLWFVLRSVVHGFEPIPTNLPCDTGMVDYLKPNAVRTFDFSGNLTPDILLEPRWKGFDSLEGLFWVLGNKRSLGDLLVEVQDHPYGGEDLWKVKVEYSNPVAPVYNRNRQPEQLDGKVIYTRPVYPLVAAYMKEMGKGNQPTKYDYGYKNYRIDRFGRGESGFGEIVSLNRTTGEVTTETFDNYTRYEYEDGKYRYPYRGILKEKQSVLNLGNGRTRFKKTVNTHDMKLYDDGARFYPYVKSKSFTEYEQMEDVEPITNWNKIYELDEWGNLTSYRKIYADDIFDEITTTYLNNAHQWIIGLTQSIAYKSVVGSDAAVRNSTHQHHPETGFLIFTEYESENPETRLTRGFWRDPHTGLINKVTENDTNQSRNTVILYDQEKIFPSVVKNAENHLFEFQYNRFTGNLEFIKDPNGLTKTFSYDGFGRETTRTIPGIEVGSTAYSWSEGEFCISRDIDGGPKTTECRDRLNRTSSERRSVMHDRRAIRHMSYNDMGLLSKVTLPMFEGDRTDDGHTKTYDLLGRILSIGGPDGESYQFEYKGRTTSITDPRNGLTIKTYNNLNQLISIVDAEGGATTYEYGPFGELGKIQNHYGNITKIDRDENGNVFLIDDPNMGISKFEYNGFGELTEKLGPDGGYHKYYYDMLGRLTRIDDPDRVTKYTYDHQENGIGYLSEAISSDAHRKEYLYDDSGRLKSSVYHYPDLRFQDEVQYDNLGRVAKYF
ncbi:MAG: hypothetical protein GY854_23190, partial [Deltaproteobacteria bacterium]|nr:hypothetical protein [Deltaproteobacteria bacterium]